ncbi:MAG: hypothetical protein QMD96_03760 [Anaerosomatales bacterium]|nr:hypothetical protein [Anaerosomatales bacterium]
MKKAIALWVLVLVAMLAAAGCVDQTRAANDAIARANAKAEEYRQLDSEVTALLDEAASVDFTPEGVAPAFPLLEQARAKIEQRQKVVSEIRAAFASIASLRVSDEVKAYAAQQVAIADLLAQADEKALALISATEEFYRRIAAKNAAGEEGQALAKRIIETSEEIERLAETIAKKRAESDAYFEEHLTGRR